MLIGIIKWFDDLKGFGMLGTLNHGDIFLHINNFKHRSTYLQQGLPISFELRFDERKGKNYAALCAVADKEQDFFSNLILLEKSDLISIEVKVSAVTTYGRKFTTSKIEQISLLQAVFKHIFLTKESSIIAESIIKHYATHSDEISIVQYVEFFHESLPKIFGEEKTSIILKLLIGYFRDNISEQNHFEIWLQKKYNLINHTPDLEYEISREILEKNIDKIGANELIRIRDFTYGSAFIEYYIALYQQNVQDKSIDQLKSGYNLLPFIEASKQPVFKCQLDDALYIKVWKKIKSVSENIISIHDEATLTQLIGLISNLPAELSGSNKDKISDNLFLIVANKITDEIKPQAWLRGILSDIPLALKSNLLLNEGLSRSDKISALNRSALNDQIELFKTYTKAFGAEEGIQLLNIFVTEEYKVPYGSFSPENIFNSEYWQNKTCGEFVQKVLNDIYHNTTDFEKLHLFKKGTVNKLPTEMILPNLSEFSFEDLGKIFSHIREKQTLILQVLQKKALEIEASNLHQYYSIADSYLESTSFEIFDQEIYERVDGDIYFNLWESKMAKIFPEVKVKQLLNENFENYKKIDLWLRNKIISRDDICNYLWSYLLREEQMNNRIIFAKVINHIKYLIFIDNSFVEKIRTLNSSLYNVILWSLDRELSLDFHQLTLCYIYFSPKEQVRIFKKLFFLKSSGKMELSVEMLNELTRFDLDLYQLNKEFNPDVPVDVSTDVIIKSLTSFAKNGKFLIESELLILVLKDLSYLEDSKFQLKDYFESCIGRMQYKFSFGTYGKEIHKIATENGFQFKINFPYDANTVNKVKSIPGRYYVVQEKQWFIPGNKEAEVLAFAQEEGFLVEMEGNHYSNNSHLATAKRGDIPTGIKFCEGRASNKIDNTFGKNFFWCKNEPCYERCESIHNEEEWEKYTLLDFCEILGFNTDDKNSVGDYILKGKFYQFIGLVNRFNRLLEKLFCDECKQVIYPVENSHFAAHAVVRFCCVNETCNKKKQIIYLNHCMNGKCNCIIDSRESKKCENGLYICSNCGSCCSHAVLSRRLDSLKSLGAYIHPNLVSVVSERGGHLERAEYSCHKCSKKMEETSFDVFYCSDCNVKYNTTPYKIKRPHKHLVKQTNSNRDNLDGSQG